MYAIIATGGKQYKVEEGDVIKVEKLGLEAGSEVTFDQVLLVGDKDVKVGTPTVDGASVKATVVRLLFIVIREKPDTTKRMVIDSHLLR